MAPSALVSGGDAAQNAAVSPPFPGSTANGSTAVSDGSRQPPGQVPASPAARRARRPSWRDPRLAVGLALVCLSVLGGARVLDRADDTVPVLAAATPLAEGMPVTAGDLVTVNVRFGSAAEADRYLSGSADLADGSVLLRPVGPGELVPRAALGSSEGVSALELPLAVDPGRVPAGVRVGSVVDVWVAGGVDGAAHEEPGDAASRAELVLSQVSVLATTGPSAVGPSGLHQVVVAVPPADQQRLGSIVARAMSGAVFLVGRPG
jgi:hypothetical protein